MAPYNRKRRLTPAQIKAMKLVREHKVPIRPFDSVPVKGCGVTHGTLWSLEDRDLVQIHGWYASGKADIRLTPFGNQVLDAFEAGGQR